MANRTRPTGSLPALSLNEFNIGDLVWARNRASDPFWPVRAVPRADTC
jgi:hypothetical protein